MKKIRIVFSSTPYVIGKIIRIVTKEKYNHTAIYADRDNAYCFGRHYQNVLLYGGFVKDSVPRYIYNGRTADICVCAIEVSDEKYDEIFKMINDMYADKESYYYNIFSALSALFHKRTRIDKAYTCVEFSVKVLSKIDGRVNENEFYTVEGLRQKYIDNIEYEGIFNLDMIDDPEYVRKKNIFEKLKYTCNNVFTLLKRL